jgi:peptide/nickel transport system substrate-binding protein
MAFESPTLSRRALLRGGALAVAGAGLGLLAACAPAAPAAPTATPAAAPPAAKPAASPMAPVAAASPSADSGAAVPSAIGGQIPYGSAQEPTRINTLTSNLVVDFEVAQMVYSFLIKVSDRLEFVPDLAMHVPTIQNGGISADGQTITFKLRPNMTWHDGRPLTADDVKFTHELVLDPRTQARTLAGYSSVDQVKTPDPQTVVFTLKEPFPAFLETWAYTNILPRHLWQDQDPNTTQLNRQPVGSGAFKLTEFTTGQWIVLERNPGYFKPGLPKVDSIVYKIVPDANALLAQVQTGEVKLRFKYPATQVPAIQNLPGVTFMRTPALNDWRIWLNVRKSVFQDVRVRQALSYGVDRQGIIDNVYKGLLTPAYTYISPRVWAHNPNAPKYPFDQVKAKALLDEAGWTPGPDGIRRKDATPLAFEIWNISGEQERVQVLQLIQARWKEIGVDMTIKPTDASTLFGSAVPQTAFDAYYSFWLTGVDPVDRNTLYLSDSKANTTGYANPEMDRVLKQAASTVDQEQRKQLYFKAQEIEGRDQPILHLFWIEQFDTEQSILNVKPNPSTQTNFWNAEEWALAG